MRETLAMQCAKDGCKKLVEPGRKYCSRDHAPFGRLFDPPTKPAANSKSLYKRKPETKPGPLHCEHRKYFTSDCADCKVKSLEAECARLREAFTRATLELERLK